MATDENIWSLWNDGGLQMSQDAVIICWVDTLNETSKFNFSNTMLCFSKYFRQSNLTLLFPILRICNPFCFRNCNTFHSIYASLWYKCSFEGKAYAYILWGSWKWCPSVNATCKMNSAAIIASCTMNPPDDQTLYKRPSGPRIKLNAYKPLNCDFHI